MSESIKTTQFRAIDHIKTQEDLDIYIRDVAGWSFRAGQEDMRRRAVESTRDMARKYHSVSQGYATVLADQAIAIASLEVKDG